MFTKFLDLFSLKCAICRTRDNLFLDGFNVICRRCDSFQRGVEEAEFEEYLEQDKKLRQLGYQTYKRQKNKRK